MLARKFNRGLSTLALAALLGVAGVAQARAACAFPSPAKVLAEEGEAHAKGSRLLQIWEFADSRLFWSQADPKV